MPAKGEVQRHHALQRFAERRQLRLSDAEYNRLCELIRYHYPYENSGTVKLLCYTSTRVSHWAVLYEGEWTPMIYNRSTRRITTVLLPGALRMQRYREAVLRHNLPLPPPVRRPGRRKPNQRERPSSEPPPSTDG